MSLEGFAWRQASVRQREGGQLDDLPTLLGRLMGTKADARPVRTSNGVGPRIAIVLQCGNELVDQMWVRAAVLEAFTDGERRQSMTEGTNIFRVLIKTLLKAGIITDRTKSVYGAWVDMGELASEDDEVVGSDVADEGIAELRDINRNRKKIGRNLKVR